MQIVIGFSGFFLDVGVATCHSQATVQTVRFRIIENYKKNEAKSTKLCTWLNIPANDPNC